MINKEEFLEALRLQFDESDAAILTFESKFSELDTWDSLTRFSIISLLEDDYGFEFSVENFKTIDTPNDLFTHLIASSTN
ncbi:acyl carrier protein [Pedobacter frigoris]|uniref:acyl carrier protein n=1 Tax=Pedobacter frigoris TaxID=2571272 RepID=UPI00292DC77A|nr:acyl carrier protein [Pedobacter frigoris]